MWSSSLPWEPRLQETSVVSLLSRICCLRVLEDLQVVQCTATLLMGLKVAETLLNEPHQRISEPKFQFQALHSASWKLVLALTWEPVHHWSSFAAKQQHHYLMPCAWLTHSLLLKSKVPLQHRPLTRALLASQAGVGGYSDRCTENGVPDFTCLFNAFFKSCNA